MISLATWVCLSFHFVSSRPYGAFTLFLFLCVVFFNQIESKTDHAITHSLRFSYTQSFVVCFKLIVCLSWLKTLFCCFWRERTLRAKCAHTHRLFLFRAYCSVFFCENYKVFSINSLLFSLIKAHWVLLSFDLLKWSSLHFFSAAHFISFFLVLHFHSLSLYFYFLLPYFATFLSFQKNFHVELL